MWIGNPNGSTGLLRALKDASSPKDMSILQLRQRRKHFLYSMNKAAQAAGCRPCQMMWKQRQIPLRGFLGRYLRDS